MVVGLDTSVEAEGKDRTTITLPGKQDDLFKAILATGKPTVVVLIHGGAIAIEYIKDNADAIVDAAYPGENGGFAIADVLFGDYNPGGMLSMVIAVIGTDKEALQADCRSRSIGRNMWTWYP